MNAPRTTEDAVNMLPVPTYLTASTAPVSLDTPVMVLPVQVRQLFGKICLTAKFLSYFS